MPSGAVHSATIRALYAGEDDEVPEVIEMILYDFSDDVIFTCVRGMWRMRDEVGDIHPILIQSATTDIFEHIVNTGELVTITV